MLDLVRREETEITKDPLERIIRKACEINLGLGRAAVDSGAWCFEEKSKLLWTYLMNKINGDMHEKAARIPNKNSLELYCLIYNSVDAIPVNAEFHMNHQLTALSVEWAPKIQNLKELYAFRVLLRQKVAEFKTRISKEPDPDKLRDILFTCMDVNSKLLAS